MNIINGTNGYTFDGNGTKANSDFTYYDGSIYDNDFEIGYITVTYTIREDIDTMHINIALLNSNETGRGYGTLMLKCIENYAKDLSKPLKISKGHIELVSKKSAVRFYLKNGFVIKTEDYESIVEKNFVINND